MNEEKTYDATAHKLSKAREEGQIAKSPELAGFVVMLFGLLGIFFFIPYWANGVMEIFHQMIKAINQNINMTDIINIAIMLFYKSALLILPIFGILMVMAVVGNIMQFGFLLSPKVILPKLSKINPIAGMKNVFSIKKLLEGSLITFKVSVAFIIGLVVFFSFFNEIEHLSLLNIYAQVLWLREKAMILIAILLFIFMVLAVTDYIVKRHQFMKQMRMSFKEIVDEHKLFEGDPHMKAKIAAMRNKILQNRMMRDIPTASVVVTNPTHFAVALRYSQDEKSADSWPRVIAKGTDGLALRIRQIAIEHEIRVIEDRQLARDLYKSTEIGQYVSEQLAMAVVELFREVQRLDMAEKKGALYRNPIRDPSGR